MKSMQQLVQDFLDEKLQQGELQEKAFVGISLFHSDRMLFDITYNTSPSSRFCIGSISKSFAATAFLKACEDGFVSLGQPIAHQGLDLRFADQVLTEQLTPLDILVHRTGLPPHDLLWIKNLISEKSQLLDKFSHVRPIPGSFRHGFSYSNLTYSLLSLLVEQKTHKRYADFLSDEVLRPLSLRDAACCPPDCADLSVIDAAGGVVSSLTDLTEWGRLHLSTLSSSKPTSVISLRHHKKMFEPLMAVDAQLPVILTGLQWTRPGLHYGFGWFVNQRNSLLLFHPGFLKDSSALIFLLPTQDLGGVVLTNTTLSPFPGALFKAIHDFFSVPVQSSNAERNITGTYRNPVYGEIEVSRSEATGRPQVTIFNCTCELFAAGPTTYRFHLPLMGLTIPLNMEFHFADSSAADKVCVPLSLGEGAEPEEFARVG